MKNTKKTPLWYNPVSKDARRPLSEASLDRFAEDREGHALLEAYCRIYRVNLYPSGR